MEEIEVVLTDGTSLEGKRDEVLDLTTGVGVHLNDVHRSDQRGTVPLAKRVFVPYSAILFIVVEK
jgi:hypothetical protein